MKKRLELIITKIEDIEFNNSVDDEILEVILRNHIPQIKEQILKIL